MGKGHLFPKCPTTPPCSGDPAEALPHLLTQLMGQSGAQGGAQGGLNAAQAMGLTHGVLWCPSYPVAPPPKHSPSQAMPQDAAPLPNQLQEEKDTVPQSGMCKGCP